MNSKLSKSLFSIINKGGDFVSTKQSAFINSQAFEGVITVRNTLTFGEWEGRTAKNTKTITFEFFVNAEGVQKVIKVNSKNDRSMFWDRSPATLAKFAVKVEKKQNKQKAADKANAIRHRLDEKDQLVKNLQDKICDLLLNGGDMQDRYILRMIKVCKKLEGQKETMTNRYSEALKAFDKA